MVAKKTDVQTASSSLGASISRRKFVQLSGAGALALAAGGTRAYAQAADTIRVGFISPRTGALAAFGEPDPYVVERARGARQWS